MNRSIGKKVFGLFLLMTGSCLLYGSEIEAGKNPNDTSAFETWRMAVLSETEKTLPADYSSVIKREVDSIVKMENPQGKRRRARFLIADIVGKGSMSDCASQVRQQCDLLICCLKIKESTADVDNWKDIARTIGSFRSRIVPGYQKKAVLNPSAPWLPEPVKKELLDENDAHLEMDRLQRDLTAHSSVLTAVLISIMKSNAKQFTHDAYTNIVSEISRLAHLTPEETKELIE